MCFSEPLCDNGFVPSLKCLSGCGTADPIRAASEWQTRESSGGSASKLEVSAEIHSTPVYCCPIFLAPNRLQPQGRDWVGHEAKVRRPRIEAFIFSILS